MGKKPLDPRYEPERYTISYLISKLFRDSAPFRAPNTIRDYVSLGWDINKSREFGENFDASMSLDIIYSLGQWLGRVDVTFNIGTSLERRKQLNALCSPFALQYFKDTIPSGSDAWVMSDSIVKMGIEYVLPEPPISSVSQTVVSGKLPRSIKPLDDYYQAIKPILLSALKGANETIFATFDYLLENKSQTPNSSRSVYRRYIRGV